MSLASRKKAKATRKQSLRQKTQEEKSNKSYEDPRMWSCSRDKSGRGSAVIRFLEPSDKDIEYYMKNFDYDETEVPAAVKQHQHGFKGPNGKWYIENCPTSVVERECPVCDANSEIVDQFGGWDAVDDNHPGKKLVRSRKRKEVYYANVLVIEDKANPENEGQVKIFKFGKAIHDQIMAQLIPEFEDEEDCDVSDFWEGRNFHLKIVKKDGYSNYDKSSWGKVAPVGDDDYIDELIGKLHTLTDFITEDKYKSYEDLQKEFDKTQGKTSNRRKPSDDSGDDGGDDDGKVGGDDTPRRSRRSRRTQEEDTPDNTPDDSPDGESDEDYFNNLLDD